MNAAGALEALVWGWASQRCSSGSRRAALG
jgi:hypothetical protein